MKLGIPGIQGIQVVPFSRGLLLLGILSALTTTHNRDVLVTQTFRAIHVHDIHVRSPSSVQGDVTDRILCSLVCYCLDYANSVFAGVPGLGVGWLQNASSLLGLNALC